MLQSIPKCTVFCIPLMQHETGRGGWVFSPVVQRRELRHSGMIFFLPRHGNGITTAGSRGSGGAHGTQPALPSHEMAKWRCHADTRRVPRPGQPRRNLRTRRERDARVGCVRVCVRMCVRARACPWSFPSPTKCLRCTSLMLGLGRQGLGCDGETLSPPAHQPPLRQPQPPGGGT